MSATDLPDHSPQRRDAFVAGPHHMEARSGVYIDLLNPNPADISIEDIAHHLSQINRYTGATARPMSVAEHAVLVAHRLRRQGWGGATVLLGLHHDDAEAYVGDVGRPLKLALGEVYRAIEQRVDAAVWNALQLHPNGNLRAVKAADDWALAAEAWHLLPSRGEGWFCWGMYDPDDPSNPPAASRLLDGCGLGADVARRVFLDMHEQVLGAWRAERAYVNGGTTG